MGKKLHEKTKKKKKSNSEIKNATLASKTNFNRKLFSNKEPQ